MIFKTCVHVPFLDYFCDAVLCTETKRTFVVVQINGSRHIELLIELIVCNHGCWKISIVCAMCISQEIWLLWRFLLLQRRHIFVSFIHELSQRIKTLL